MRAFRIFISLVFALSTWHLIVSRVTASEEGALSKTSLSSQRTSVITTLPHGILVGEFDGRIWNQPYNGLFISQDLGESWETLGLEGRGITDISYHGGRLYVSTYYNIGNQIGLFISSDGGISYHHAGLDFSSSRVEAVQDAVYVGGYSHGLWISKDNGQTWKQKIGDGSGWSGPHITELAAQENIALAATSSKVYRSTDAGDNWEEIEELLGQQISSIYIDGFLILAGTNNEKGLFRSIDGGSTWHRVVGWENSSVGEIEGFKNTVYAQKIDSSVGSNKLYRSFDSGLTWTDIIVDPEQRLNSMEVIYSYPSYLFLSTESDGLHKYVIPKNPLQHDPLFVAPWKGGSGDRMTDKITAYFDHQYPLLGYQNHSEPSQFKDSTVNFLGFTDNIYDTFYSSHNGIDFALPLGKGVVAASPGSAKYYYCDWCGHSIKIDHQNGYQTTYMHLQKDSLITNNSDDAVWVDSGEVIGKVGMSGRTSGPHLHFSIMFDKNHNGVFDDFPDGLVDPFSWFDPYNQDPWPLYTWQDAAGEHTGTPSEYIWASTLPVQRIYVPATDQTTVLGNKTIHIDLDQFESNLFTATVTNYIKPYIPFSQLNLEYIEGTSVSVTGSDHYEEEVLSIDGSLTLTIDLTNLSLKNVAKDTLKIFVWDPLKKRWEPLPTIIDHVNNRVSAETSHLSHFAVMGEKICPDYPVSTLTTEGFQQDGWFLDYPLVTLSPQDYSGTGIKDLYYSINKGVDWKSYSQPFYIDQTGIVTIMYRAEDNSGNLEPTNYSIFKIDTQQRWKDKIKIIDAQFSTSAY